MPALLFCAESAKVRNDIWLRLDATELGALLRLKAICRVTRAWTIDKDDKDQ